MASRPVLAVSTFMPRRSSTLLKAKMLRTSSSTTNTCLPTRFSSEACRRSAEVVCRAQLIDHPVQEERVSSSRRSGDSTPLNHDAARHGVQTLCSSGVSSLPVKTTTGTSFTRSSSRILRAPQSRTYRARADRGPCSQYGSSSAIQGFGA